MGISNTSEKLNASALHSWIPLGIFEWVGLLVNRELSWKKDLPWKRGLWGKNLTLVQTESIIAKIEN